MGSLIAYQSNRTRVPPILLRPAPSNSGPTMNPSNNRRWPAQCYFVTTLVSAFVALPCGLVEAAMSTAASTPANVMTELSFESAKDYADPFNQVQLDVVFVDPAGKQLRVPAFWDGGKTWRVRYASGTTGTHRYTTQCSDQSNAGLEGQKGTVEVVPYGGKNPLYVHGPLRVRADGRHFEHADGTPFLWLGDTWWMGLCKRLHFPDEFASLERDRIAKGFNVVQIVAGLYPDMPAFDPRGENESGFPWTPDYRTIRPEYFDAADRRMLSLVDAGLTPCVVGAWGYHLPWLGVARMNQHWRYLVARYGALPVVWCVAGEITMPFYLSKTKEQDSEFQRQGWTEVAHELRRVDPFHRLVTGHPPRSARYSFTDPSVLDFDMLQTGHSDRKSIPNTIKSIRTSRGALPTLPVVLGEVTYEGILDTCFEDVQQFMVWSSYLSGTAGHTYGANGIWQVNRREQPYGKSPHGGNWGNRPWDDAMNLPGSRQLGLAKRLLEKFDWWKFEPHPEWASWQHTDPKRGEFDVPYAAGIPNQVRMIYVPAAEPVVVHNLDAKSTWTLREFDPRTGELKEWRPATPDPHGNFACAPETAKGDWVVILESSAKEYPAVSLHPDNPRYFLFRGRPLALVAATEHYGSVINRAFDFDRYLTDAADKHQTMTRTFLLFREQQSARNPSSPCKPESPDFVTPWLRTGPGNAIDGEPRYDLDRWNPEYFERLHRFLSRASERGIVVELTLFSNTYGDGVWALNPLRAENNLQGVGKLPWSEYNTLHNQPLLDRQLAYARKIIQETSGYDNVYYEICNEPGGNADARASVADVDAWQERIAAVVREELTRAGRPHLIFGSQAFNYRPAFRQELDASFAGKTFDAVDVHPLPGMVLGGKDYMLGNFMSKQLVLRDFRDFCRATQAFQKPCIPDEDNTASMYRDPIGWTIHRKRAWTALFSGCHYDYIDFSITAGSETGTVESNRLLRTWMKHLSDFMQTIDFVHAKPAHDLIGQAPLHVVDSALALPDGGYVAYLADDREVADPGYGRPISGTIAVHLPRGHYHARFYAPTSGSFSSPLTIQSGDQPVPIELSPFTHDVVVEITPER
jgi:hypothetical protein